MVQILKFCELYLVARFEVFTAVKIHVTVFWVMTPYSDVVQYLVIY